MDLASVGDGSGTPVYGLDEAAAGAGGHRVCTTVDHTTTIGQWTVREVALKKFEARSRVPFVQRKFRTRVFRCDEDQE